MKKINATYSALGRIRRLLIFDTTQYEISSDDHFPYGEIRDKYINLVTALNAFNNAESAEVYLFFEINPFGYQSGPLVDQTLGIHFVPVNVLNPQASIPTGWIQDIVYVLPDDTLLLNQSMISEALAKVITEYTGATSYKFMRRSCPGGNVLRGRLNDEDYMLHGFLGRKDCNEFFLKQSFGVPLHRIHTVYDNDMKPFSPLFYHADLYSTLIGPVKGNRELILLAKCDSANYPQVRKGLDDLRVKLGEMSAAREEAGKSCFVYLDIPFLVLKDENGKIVHALSYNNCLVENFIDESGARRIRIYFPDYRQELHDFAEQHYENDLVMRFLVGSIFSAAVTSNIDLPLSPKKKTIDPILTTVFLNQVHELIRTKLTEFDITEVAFIKHDFRDLAKRLGSLRCMTKVIERDCV